MCSETQLEQSYCSHTSQKLRLTEQLMSLNITADIKHLLHTPAFESTLDNRQTVRLKLLIHQ